SYHMQCYHGISAVSAQPFSPPVAFRVSPRPAAKSASKGASTKGAKADGVKASKHEKTHLCEGLCHKCQKWIPVEGIKAVDVKVREIYWWKHAISCHQGSQIDGEAGHMEPDSVYSQLQAL
ncbi:hypothetical protein FISHEDRAFT_20331, partial [Fistulina hepatica ATCC 64428]